jgi:hypothetical protein
VNPDFFRYDINEAEFRQHARENYTIGKPIDPEAIRHPVWVHEAATMNYQEWSRLAKRTDRPEPERHARAEDYNESIRTSLNQIAEASPDEWVDVYDLDDLRAIDTDAFNLTHRLAARRPK